MDDEKIELLDIPEVGEGGFKKAQLGPPPLLLEAKLAFAKPRVQQEPPKPKLQVVG
jgi:hypothetical protein